MSRFFGFLQRHGIIVTLVIIWGIALTTWVTLQVFSSTPPNIPTGTAAAYATLFGLPGIAVGLWKWKSDKWQDK